MNKAKELLSILLLYLIAAIVVTYPLILHLQDSYRFFSSSVPTVGEIINVERDSLGSDTLLDLWTHWFFQKSFEGSRLPLTTDLFYNVKVTPVAASINNWISPVLSLFLSPFLGLLGSFNLQILLILSLNGLATYVFVKRFVGSRAPSFLAGLFVLCSAYVYNRSLEHLGLMTIFPSILFLHFFLRILEDKRKADYLWGGLFLALSGLFSWYFLFYGLVIGLILSLFLWWRRVPGTIGPLGALAKITTVSFLVLSPFTVLFLGVVRANFLRTTYQSSFNFSADLFSLLLPGPNSLLWAPLTRGFYEKILIRFTSPIEKESTFLGYVGLVAAFYFLFKVRHKWKGAFLTIFFSAVLLALGPYLTFLGRPTLPLPYALLGFFLPILQSPNRFIVFALIAESVFVGFWTASLFRRLKTIPLRVLAASALGLYLLLENVSYPYRLSSFNFDNYFYRGLRNQKDLGSILNLPVSYVIGTGNIYYLSQQILFNQKMLNGYSAPLATPFIRQTPYYSPELYPLACFLKEPLPEDYDRRFRRFLAENQVTYVLLHKRIMALADCQAVSGAVDWLTERGILSEKVFEDDRLVVFGTEELKKESISK